MPVGTFMTLPQPQLPVSLLKNFAKCTSPIEDSLDVGPNDGLPQWLSLSKIELW